MNTFKQINLTYGDKKHTLGLTMFANVKTQFSHDIIILDDKITDFCMHLLRNRDFWNEIISYNATRKIK